MLGSISFGTWKDSSAAAEDIMQLALSCGFRSLDTAAAYANERDIGRAICSSGIAREELFVSGKLWVTRRTHDAAIKACKKSLKNLGLDYFDQYLIHWPASSALHDDAAALNAETWGAFEELVRSGLARRIGVCNYSKDELLDLLQYASINPCVNQIEMHPGHYPKELVAFCANNGIGIEAWSPLGHGAVLDHPLVARIAQECSCTPAQVCLKWCAERGADPIVGASSEAHMLEAFNFDVVEIPESYLAQIDQMEPCGFSGNKSEADVL